MSEEVVARKVVVHGRVQGVFFRDSCTRKAREAGVTGWVRNEPDGSVSALFEGTVRGVDQMMSWCRQGPPRSRVDRVDVTEVRPTGAATFDVLG